MEGVGFVRTICSCAMSAYGGNGFAKGVDVGSNRLIYSPPRGVRILSRSLCAAQEITLHLVTGGNLKRSVLVLVFAMTAGVATPAFASAIVYFDACAPAGCSNGTWMTITPDARHDGTGMWGGDVKVVVQTPSIYGNNALGFNVAGSGVTISNLSTGSYSLGGSNESIDPFGTFEFLIDGPAPLTDIRQLSFWLSRDGGFSHAASIFETNAAGYIAATNSYEWVYNPAVPRYEVGATFTEGATGVINPTPVPEPGTMLLLATGLAAAWRSRRSSP